MTIIITQINVNNNDFIYFSVQLMCARVCIHRRCRCRCCRCLCIFEYSHSVSIYLSFGRMRWHTDRTEHTHTYMPEVEKCWRISRPNERTKRLDIFLLNSAAFKRPYSTNARVFRNLTYRPFHSETKDGNVNKFERATIIHVSSA